MKYWLMKTEPDVYSWDDLKNAPGRSDSWEGVRNYQARNYMREMQRGDLVLFYHSRITPPAIVGVARVVRAAYPDPTQFDPSSKYYDPHSDADNPRWDIVDIHYHRDFDAPIPLPELKEVPGLQDMVLLRKGNRLSIQPVTEAQWCIITGLRQLK